MSHIYRVGLALSKPWPMCDLIILTPCLRRHLSVLNLCRVLNEGHWGTCLGNSFVLLPATLED